MVVPMFDPISLDDGGVIEPPEPDTGTIRRRDKDGNVEEVRLRDDDDWDEWAQVFGVTWDDFPAISENTGTTLNPARLLADLCRMCYITPGLLNDMTDLGVAYEKDESLYEIFETMINADTGMREFLPLINDAMNRPVWKVVVLDQDKVKSRQCARATSSTEAVKYVLVSRLPQNVDVFVTEVIDPEFDMDGGGSIRV